jgi:MarR family 2-MHQ and catechol resistance regulon transcriptional repressor
MERIFPGHVRAIVDQFSVLTPREQEEMGRLCKKIGRQGGPSVAIMKGRREGGRARAPR